MMNETVDIALKGKEDSVSQSNSSTVRKYHIHEPDATNGDGSRKRMCTESENSQKGNTIPLQTQRAPFGRFAKGTEVFRNRIADNETNADGHYAIEELILPGSVSALCTTFEPPSREWAHEIFADIPDLMIVRPPQGAEEKDHIVGEALLRPISKKRRNKWFWIIARPHTGGCLHSKLLLFRSNQGLRVVVAGCNLSERQWKSDRDIFWAKDFPVLANNEGSKSGPIGTDLISFMKDITKCADWSHQTVVNKRLENVFKGIDFSEKKNVNSETAAKLVVSFPRRQESGEDVGGWISLAAAVRDILFVLYEPDDDSSVESAEEASNVGILYANSGSVGDLEPDFVEQMYQAMNGRDVLVPRQTTWAQVEDRFRWLWPSVRTASSMNPLTLLGSLRGIPNYHYPSIPLSAKEKVFHDAPPNPANKAKMPGSGGRDEFHAVTHGKFMYNRSRGIIYIGSHNFSKAAWGLHTKQPQNVEVGIVLASASPTTQLLWNNRLPCHLPTESRAPKSYIPFALPWDVYSAYRMSNDIFQAVELLKQWFRKSVTDQNQNDESDNEDSDKE